MPNSKEHHFQFKEVELDGELKNSFQFCRKILMAHEEEKKRISRDLHDESGQIVIGLSTTFNVIEKEIRSGNTGKALQLIDDTRGLIKTLSVRMKSLALILRPPALDVLGLSAVLREYFWQCSKNNEIKIEFNENLKDRKIEPGLEITIYRIVQEALNNVLKHSKASLVMVSLLIKKNKIQLIIEDNGQGFDFKNLKNGIHTEKLGLSGINERVSAFNGKFFIDSVLKKGTTLIISLPL